MQRRDKEEEILCAGFHCEFNSRVRWEATSSTSVDGENSCSPLTDWSLRVGWMSISLWYFHPPTLSAALKWPPCKLKLLEMMKAFSGYKPAAATDCLIAKTAMTVWKTRQNCVRVEKGTARAWRRDVWRCSESRSAKKASSDLLRPQWRHKWSAARQLQRKEMVEHEAET